MYLVCPACSKRLQIPDNKLPTDHAVRITCPSCQERFSYDPRTQRAGSVSSHDTPLAPPGGVMTPPRMVDPNALQALICLDTPTHQDVCQYALQTLGYTADVMPNQFKAIEYLRQVPYRLFVLDAGFDGTSLDTNLVLTFLRERPLEQRRYQFVALCAPDVVTADPMMAYGQNVNLVINHADMPNCGTVLVQHLAEHELLYRTFREMRQQLGKEV
ncbi:MAG: zinc-ribbon domain-containing protein [Candidatus Tectimicrobiota bacterium]